MIVKIITKEGILESFQTSYSETFKRGSVPYNIIKRAILNGVEEEDVKIIKDNEFVFVNTAMKSLFKEMKAMGKEIISEEEIMEFELNIFEPIPVASC